MQPRHFSRRIASPHKKWCKYRYQVFSLIIVVMLGSAGSGGNVKFRRGFFNTVKSDAGFSVKDRSIQGFAEYREGGRRATVPVETISSNLGRICTRRR